MEIPLKKKTTISMASSSTSFEQVPNDVTVDNIFRRLDVATRARLSVLCRSWRDLSRQALPAMPCLIVPGRLYPPNWLELDLLAPVSPTAGHSLVVSRRVDLQYNIAGCRGPYLIYTPPASPWYSIVYNPFSGKTLQLPSMVRRPDGSEGSVGYLKRAQLSSTPASCTSTGRTTPCLVAAVASNFPSSVCICRLGVHGAVGGDDQKPYWIVSRLPGKDMSIEDLIFHDGALYCICKNRTGHRIMAINLHPTSQ